VTSLSDFIKSYGPPRDGNRVVPEDVARYRGRLPDGLLALWTEFGVGSFAEGRYWICLPDPYQMTFDELFSELGDLAVGDLTLFGYSCVGEMHFWHRAGRHFTLDIATGLLMDVTSLQKTAPVPYDIDDLAAAIGVSPEEFRAAFLQSQEQPADFWMTLSSLADPAPYKDVLDDSGRPLIGQLRRGAGALSAGQIYFCENRADGNLASNYSVAELRALINAYPRRLLYARYTLTNGVQTVIETDVLISGRT
jgi:hypothetical protein